MKTCRSDYAFSSAPRCAQNNNNNNSNDYSKKEEFRRYLEKSGVLEALTKVLVGLYEEPDRQNVNAMSYIKQYMGAPGNVDIEGIKRENEDLRRQVAKLQKQLAEK